MTIGQIVVIGFLVVLVVLILWNIREHRRSGETSETLDHIGNAWPDPAGD